jgi:hypothetical protein
MHNFRRIFLSNYWWQKSDVWSQASYRYPILWEAFFDPSDSYFLFVEERGYHRWALAHSSSCYFCLPWLLESCIPVISFICPPPLFFSFWNISVLWSNTTEFVITHTCVIFSRRTMSRSNCSMVQLYIAREWIL